MIQTPLFAAAQSLVRAGQYTPRPYQVRADVSIDRELSEKRSTLVVQATGCGKTVLFCLQAAKRGGALVLAHRDSLIRQAAEKLAAATGANVEIEKASERASQSDYIVASVQTLRGERLRTFAANFPRIPFIVIDECHRATAKTYRDILAAWPEAKVLGVTATADRTDGKGLGAIFESVADRYEILDATMDGWLAPLKWVPVKADVDLSHVKVVGKGDDRDFDQADLDDEIVKCAGEMAKAVHHAVQESGNPDMRLIVFTPGVKTAHAGAAAMNEMLPGSAAVVDGMMEDRLKRGIIQRFTAGELRYLFNCGVLTEGYDDPTLIGIFDAAPTKSRLRAMQKWGRVTRPWPGIVDLLHTSEERRAAIAASRKPWGLVYDLALNSTHDVIGPIDLLAGKPLKDSVKRKAKEIMDARGGSPEDAIAEAEEHEREKARRARAAKRMAAAVKVTLGQPRSVFDRAGVTHLQRSKLPTRPEDKLHPAVRGLMNYRGIPIPPNCTRQMASRLIKVDKKREKAGMCRLGGLEWLRQHGVDGWQMPSVVARRVRDAIVANGGKITPEQMAPLLSRAPGEDDDE